MARIRTTTRISTTHRAHKSTFSLFTPMRKLFLEMDHNRTRKRVRKREIVHDAFSDIHEGRGYSGLNDRIVPTPPSSPSPRRYSSTTPTQKRNPSLHHCHQAPDRVALQNEDDEINAVVITTLDTVPFCCHEELLSMSRTQLIITAQTLNTKLPTILCIDTENTDRFIRNSIEILVGIREATFMSPPAAPKTPRPSFSTVNGMDREEEEDDDDDQPLELLLNISPLAKRGRRSSMYGSPCATPRLSRLVEEEEETEGDPRPLRRRKVVQANSESGDVVMDGSTPLKNRSARFEPLQESPTLRKGALVSTTKHADLSFSIQPRLQHRRITSEALNSGKTWSPLRGAGVSGNAGYRASSLSVTDGPL